MIFFFNFLINLIRLIKKSFKTKKSKIFVCFLFFKIKIKIEELKFFCFNFSLIKMLSWHLKNDK